MSSDPKTPFDAPPSSTPDLLQRDMNLDRRTRPLEPTEAWQVQAPEDVATPIESLQPAAARTRLEQSIDEIGPAAFEPTIVRPVPTAPEESTRIERALRAPPSPTDFAQQRSTAPHATRPPLMNTPRAPLPRASTSDALRAPPAIAPGSAQKTPQQAMPAMGPPPTASAHGARALLPRTATSPETVRAQVPPQAARIAPPSPTDSAPAARPPPRTATSPETTRAQVPPQAARVAPPSPTDSAHGSPALRTATSPETVRAPVLSQATRVAPPSLTDSAQASRSAVSAPRTSSASEAVRAQTLAPPSAVTVPQAPRLDVRPPRRPEVTTDELLAARPTQAHAPIPQATELQYASPLAPISTRTEVQYSSPSLDPLPEPPPRAEAPRKRSQPIAVERENVVTAEPAALWRRLGAWLTDLLFIGVTVLGLLVLAMGVIAPKGLTPLQQLAAIAIPGLLLAAVLAFVYTALFAFLWDGRTPGRRLLGIQLVTPTGESPGPIRALVRAALSLVSFALFLSGFWLALFDRHGQTLHDKLTRTFVVKLQDA